MLFLQCGNSIVQKVGVNFTCVLQLGSGESLLLEKMAEIQGVVAFDEKKLATSLHTFVSPIAIY